MEELRGGGGETFDTIPHERLLKKLHRIGVRTPLIQLLTSYLENRKQLYRYQSTYSQTKNVPCGVGQGTALGPLLFTLYINDLFSVNTAAKLYAFADDTTLLTSATCDTSDT